MNLLQVVNCARYKHHFFLLMTFSIKFQCVIQNNNIVYMLLISVLHLVSQLIEMGCYQERIWDIIEKLLDSQPITKLLLKAITITTKPTDFRALNYMIFSFGRSFVRWWSCRDNSRSSNKKTTTIITTTNAVIDWLQQPQTKINKNNSNNSN